MSNTTLACWNDLQARLQLIAELDSKVFKASDAENLAAQLKALPPPAVGVVYEGTRGSAEPGFTKQGNSRSVVFGLYLTVNNVKFLPGADTKGPTLTLLESMEEAVRKDRSPSGHKWQFLSQSLTLNNKDHAVWVQRWQTPVVN